MREVKTTDDVYETFGRVFVELAGAPSAATSVGRLSAVIQFVISDPDAVVTASLTPSLQRADLGPTDLSPDMTLRMSYEVAERFLLGELNPFLALDQGELAIEGQVTRLAVAYPLLRRIVAPSFRAKLFGPLPGELVAEIEAVAQEAMGHPELAAASQ